MKAIPPRLVWLGLGLAQELEDLALAAGDIGSLARSLQEMSAFVDLRHRR